MIARRPVIQLADLPKYLEVFPLPDSALTISITTVLRELRRTKYTKAPGIDLLPLLRADWKSSPFLPTFHHPRWSFDANDAKIEFLLLLLEESYDELVFYDELWEDAITALYFNRCPSSLHPEGVKEYVTLCLSAEVDVEASDDEKLDMFQHFVDCTSIRLGQGFETRCISGTLSMVAEENKATVVEHLAVIAKV
jgi:hypothetical protein